jgi:hypothetical protein
MNRRVSQPSGSAAPRPAVSRAGPNPVGRSIDAEELGDWIHRELAQHTTALAFLLQGLLERTGETEFAAGLARAVTLAERTSNAVRALSDQLGGRTPADRCGEAIVFPETGRRASGGTKR